MNHKLVKHKNCCIPYCNICDGGLAFCEVCGGAECSLTAECCGRQLTTDEQDAVCAGKLDYYNGRWYHAPNFGATDDKC